MTVSDSRSSAAADVDEQFTQIASQITQTLRLLVAASPPPVVLRAAKQSGTLTKRHLPALLTITYAGPLSVSELAARLRLGLPATSTIVGELSRAGLVARSEDETDRRRTIVRLDDRHRDQISAWAHAALAPLRRTLERLSPEGREQFVEGWRILHEEATLTAEQQCTHG
ncbi:MAG TPA: MarR family winged helix-turn-helix transcriptional regulator [Solirubrobacteraceae bacterium]|jgi:DNA-binding MarR family transcriptional regulator